MIEQNVENRCIISNCDKTEEPEPEQEQINSTDVGSSDQPKIHTDTRGLQPPVFNIHIHVPPCEGNDSTMFLPRIQPVIHLHFDEIARQLKLNSKENEEATYSKLRNLLTMTSPKFGDVKFHYKKNSERRIIKNSELNMTIPCSSQNYCNDTESNTSEVTENPKIIMSRNNESVDSNVDNNSERTQTSPIIDNKFISNLKEPTWDKIVKDFKLKKAVVVLTDITKSKYYKNLLSGASSVKVVNEDESYNVLPEIKNTNAVEACEYENQSIKLEKETCSPESSEVHRTPESRQSVIQGINQCSLNNMSYSNTDNSSAANSSFNTKETLTALAEGCNFSEILNRFRVKHSEKCLTDHVKCSDSNSEVENNIIIKTCEENNEENPYIRNSGVVIHVHDSLNESPSDNNETELMFENSFQNEFKTIDVSAANHNHDENITEVTFENVELQSNASHISFSDSDGEEFPSEVQSKPIKISALNDSDLRITFSSKSPYLVPVSSFQVIKTNDLVDFQNPDCQRESVKKEMNEKFESHSKNVKKGKDLKKRASDACSDVMYEISSEGSAVSESSGELFSFSSDSFNFSSSSEELPSGVPEAASTFTAPSGLQWEKTPQQQHKTSACNILRHAPGLKLKDRISTPLDCFNYFITEGILIEIVHCTNLEGRRVAQEKGITWKDIDLVELQAFFGLLLQAGLDRSWDMPLRELFTDKYAKPIYQAVMSRRRFEEIRRYMRFDDKRTRSIRLETDKLAMVSAIWEWFLQKCRTAIIPNKNVTVDEQLIPFRGRCKFKQYMPSKPSKYGIKIFWMCESETGFALDGIPYVGRQNTGDKQINLGYKIVRDIVKSVHHTGFNVTVDNFFTSVPLAKYLLTKNLTVVGTIRQNKRDIPGEMKKRNRAVFSTIFGFCDKLTLVSYVPKKNKNVLLLSSMHNDAVVDDSPKKKPEIITYYNKTKGGVDIMDQKVKLYTCKRQTKRWPMAFFCNILDVACHNAFILFIKKFPDYNATNTGRRRIFMKELVEQLVLPNIIRRSENPILRREIKNKIEHFVSINEEKDVAANRPGTSKKKRCYMCPSQKDRKTSMRCIKCSKNICNEHSDKICKNCI